jgi:hypothetical protein
VTLDPEGRLDAEPEGHRDAEPAMPPRPVPTAMYPADVVDGYIRRAETTIARLKRELADAQERVAQAVRALTGDVTADDWAPWAADSNPARGEATADDALGQFLSALHERAPSPSTPDAGGTNPASDGRGTSGPSR